MKHYYRGGVNATLCGNCEMETEGQGSLYSSYYACLAHQLVVSVINYKYKRSYAQKKKYTALQYA